LSLESEKIQKLSPDCVEDCSFKEFGHSQEGGFKHQASGHSADVFRLPEQYLEALVKDPGIRAIVKTEIESQLRQQLKGEVDSQAKVAMERGYQEGMQKGLEESQSLIQPILSRLNEVCENIIEEKHQLLHSHEKMWGNAMRHLLHRFYFANPEELGGRLTKWVSDNVAQFPDVGKVEVIVSEEDYLKIQVAVGNSENRKWNLISDSGLKSGEIKCECSEGGFFFSSEKELAKLDESIAQFITVGKR